MRTKIVDGIEVPMTPTEEAARDAEEAAWTASEPARIAERTRVQSLDQAIVGDTVLQTLKAMTAAQFSAWFDSNISTLADARIFLKRLSFVIIHRLL